MNNLSSFLEDNSGGFSSIRLLMLLWGVGVMIVWTYLSINSNQMIPIPDSVVTILLGTGAIKAVQRFGENSNTSSENCKK